MTNGKMQIEFKKKEELRQFLNQSYTSFIPFSIVISPLIRREASLVREHFPWGNLLMTRSDKMSFYKDSKLHLSIKNFQYIIYHLVNYNLIIKIYVHDLETILFNGIIWASIYS